MVHGTLLAKLEYLNPGGSKKGRVTDQIIANARASGVLLPGQTVLELTSGNTGAGLGIVCAVTGHRFVAVLSRGSSIERARMVPALGDELVLTDQAPGSVPGRVSVADLALVDEPAQRLIEQRDAFRCVQFGNPSNVRAHYRGTGRELWDRTGPQLDVFVDFAGTGGCLAGVTPAPKRRKPAIQRFAVEPHGAVSLVGQHVCQPNHRIQAGGLGRPNLTYLRDVPLDGYIQISGNQARATTQRLAAQEGIFARFSVCGDAAAALTLLGGQLPGETIAMVIPDSGLKYLSTDLWPCEPDLRPKALNISRRERPLGATSSSCTSGRARPLPLRLGVGRPSRNNV